ncbi:hypothetical protein MKW98_003589 [Papaver atlanticum]|uniref:RBR-type E3 ubiquitin transferase n=1 Tax=Papaver atlanticum TaxID=357466 RepID=A0AAD4XF70_9MAGN|nr:hypothetical protein MKW98_003589 [Papaver atlanticum]
MENLENPSSDTSFVDNEISEINLDATSRNYDEDNNNSFFTCEICVELVPLNSKFENIDTICSHNYCKNCIAKYIQVKVSQDNMSQIKCPNANCSVVLDTLSCRSILSENVFEKWCRVHCESAVLLESSKGGFAYGRSYCPYRDCSELVLNECVETNGSNKVTKSNCPNCKKLFCFHCMVPWKDNHRCVDRNESIIDIDSNDVLFIENAKLNKWVRCPSCYHYVERNQGCNTIVCRCKTVFCYSCGKKVCICRYGPLCEILLFCICLLIFWPIIGLYGLYRLIHWGAGKLSTPAPDHKLAGGINTGKPQQQKTQAVLQKQLAPPTRQ